VIDRHRHDDHQLIYVSRGVVSITTAHGSWVASIDRALWVPAGTWHEHRFYGESSFHTVGFPTTKPPLSTETPTVIAVDGLLRELLVALTGPALSPEETRHIHALLRDRLRHATIQPLALPTPRDARLAEVCHLVESDLPNPRTLAWLAPRVNASQRTLSRLFRTEFGMTYPQWRTRVRIFRAMLLLAEGASVTETAHACGWATTSAFVHTFANTMGVTPGAHRPG
jgi:AraC-like DNA-binding protein